MEKVNAKKIDLTPLTTDLLGDEKGLIIHARTPRNSKEAI